MASIPSTYDPLPSAHTSLCSPSVRRMVTCSVVPCKASTSPLMMIHHLQSTHPEYYNSINTDFGKSGVKSIIKWLTLMPASSSSYFTCHKCGKLPFSASSSSLTKPSCIACPSRGFKVIIHPNPQGASYSADPGKPHPAHGIDTVSERVTLHTSLSRFPPSIGRHEVYVCFQCRVLLDEYSDVEGHLRHSPCHETNVIAQLEMRGRRGLADMLPKMFIVRGNYATNAYASGGKQEAEKLPMGSGQGTDIGKSFVKDGEQDRPVKKRLKLFDPVPDIGSRRGSGRDNSFDGKTIFVAGRLGKGIQPQSNSKVTNNSNQEPINPTDLVDSKEEAIGQVDNPTIPALEMTRKRIPSVAFITPARELPAVIIIKLIDFNRSIVITNPITLASLAENIVEYLDDNMRPGFRGVTGSNKAPAWTGLSDRAWNGMWDEELWKLLKSRGEKRSLAPIVDVVVLWRFDAA